MKKNIGIYIHIPFCERKCTYCGFLSFDKFKTIDVELYIEDLKREIKKYQFFLKDYTVDSIFIGGGTPSILSSNYITVILDMIYSNYSLEKNCEITMESNPSSLSKEKFKVYKKEGINRLSIGCQSFDSQVLNTLGRCHSSDTFLQTYENAREIGFTNINIDLMFGIPNQSLKSWQKTVDKVIDLNPEHISFYSMQLEDGTKLYNDYKENKIDLLPISLDREMYYYGIDQFEKNNYIHYEISNGAKEGFECKHNLKYWNMKPYMGFGLGASSFLEGRRFQNSSIMFKWQEESYKPFDIQSFQKSSIEDEMSIFTFTSFRLLKGLNLNDFKSSFKKDFFTVYKNQIDDLYEYETSKDVIIDNNVIKLTRKGIGFSNQIMSLFV